MAEIQGDTAVAERLEAARALLPSGEPDAAWGVFVKALVEAVYLSVARAPVDDKLLWPKFILAFNLACMCRDAVANGYALPVNVARHYGRRPQRGSLGGRLEVAGAFAIAQGFHPGPLENAKEWIKKEDVLGIGERAGLKYPGLGRQKAA